MKRFPFYTLFISALLLLLSSCNLIDDKFNGANSGQQLPERPNILLIISDQHSGLIMSQAGYPHVNTPGIDKLAAEGVTYTRSYCAYPVCVAERASFLTGMMPSKAQPNLTSYQSIGKTLLNADYQTAYFGKWHVASSKIKEVETWHAFEEYKDLRVDTDVANLTVEYLKRDHDKPFFMITSFLNPHDCCELARNMSGIEDDYHDGAVEEQMDTAFCPPLPANFAIPPNEAEGFWTRRLPDTSDFANYRKHPVKYWGETEWRQYMYGYDRLVEKVDGHILSIMNTLEAEGLLENTLVIYTSDHGDGHSSHQWNQKMTFYEESVNVPFVLAWKGQTYGGKIDRETLVNSGIDLYPTICRAAGIEWPDMLPGADLMPNSVGYLGDQSLQRDYVVSEIRQQNRNPEGQQTFTGRMIVSKDFKYMLFDGGQNREQFFDIAKDPGELNPVTANPAYQDALNQHRVYLKEWIGATQDDFPTEQIPGA